MRAGDSTKSLEQGNVLSPAQGEFTIAHGGGAAEPGKAIPSLLLLFPRGKRPGSDALRDVLNDVSHGALPRADGIAVSLDHSDITGSDEDGPWFELIANAVTMELRGFGAAKSSDAMTAKALSASIDEAAEAAGFGQLEALMLHVSPHLESGAMATPVLRALCSAGARIGAHLEHLAAFAWPDSGVLVAPARFNQMIDDWSTASQPSAAFFVGFRDEIDRGMVSRGLARFTQQELRLEPELVEDRSDAIRLGQRVAAQLIPMGRMSEAQEFTLPDTRILRLEPSANGRFVRAFLG